MHKHQTERLKKIKDFFLNEWTETQIKSFMKNAQWQIPVPYGSKLHIPPIIWVAAQQEPYKKA